jgi:hypothetical protein
VTSVRPPPGVVEGTAPAYGRSAVSAYRISASRVMTRTVAAGRAPREKNQISIDNDAPMIPSAFPAVVLRAMRIAVNTCRAPMKIQTHPHNVRLL